MVSGKVKALQILDCRFRKRDGGRPQGGNERPFAALKGDSWGHRENADFGFQMVDLRNEIRIL